MLVLALTLVANAVPAQTQMATAGSSGPFELRGALVNSQAGVPSWPLIAGDNLVTEDSPVVITFRDGSIVTLGVGSKATIEMSGQTPALDLTSGSLQFALKSRSSVTILQYGQVISPKGLAGELGAGGGQTALSAFHAGITMHEALIAAGVVGAGVALGYKIPAGLTGGASVSPSK
jgi:hypothetical protein